MTTVETLDGAVGARFGVQGFTPYKGRDLAEATSVSVYRNLNEQQRTGRVRWSIRDQSTGLVLGHADKVALSGAWPQVNPAAQKRIAAGGNRTVHAWINGQLAFCPSDGSPWYAHAERVVYRPRESDRFRFADSDAVFVSAPLVRFDEHGMWARMQ